MDETVKRHQALSHSRTAPVSASTASTRRCFCWARTCRAMMRTSRMYCWYFPPRRVPASTASPRGASRRRRAWPRRPHPAARAHETRVTGPPDRGRAASAPGRRGSGPARLAPRARRLGCAGQRSRHPLSAGSPARGSRRCGGPTEDDVRVAEESVRPRLIALAIKEMSRDGETVTVTNRGRPVGVLSPVPASEETHSAFVGTMRGTVARHRSARRGPYMDRLTPRVVQSSCEDPALHRGRPPPFRQRW